MSSYSNVFQRPLTSSVELSQALVHHPPIIEILISKNCKFNNCITRVDAFKYSDIKRGTLVSHTKSRTYFMYVNNSIIATIGKLNANVKLINF